MNKEIQKQIWDDELYNALNGFFVENGWLTIDWATILENNFSNWDENYNDTNILGNLYSRMYNKEFEKSPCGLFIRPDFTNLI